ncbi:TRAP transporter substrate-binding protein [Anaerotruncus colihominis]|nr:TRAP transporter substrate-binding protein [Anaerotruncus colihominis]
MKKIISIALTAILVCSLFAGCSEKAQPDAAPDTADTADAGSYPTPENPITLKFGHISPDTSDMHANAVLFKETVEEKTGGAVIVEIYPNGQLGGEETMLDSIFSGTMDMGIISANVAATTIPEFNCIVLPFYFDSFEQVGSVIANEEFYQKTAEIVEKKGVHFLGTPLMAARGILNTKHSVRTPEDLKGLKIRVNTGSILADTFDAMGVTTTQLAFGEVYTALQQNVIDGLDNGIFASNMMKFTEVAKYFTNTMHYFQLSPLFISDQAYQKLSPEQRNILRESCKEVEAILVDEANKSDAGAYEVAETELGVEVIHLTDAQFQTFRDLVQPVYDKYVPLIGEEYYDFVTSIKK